MPDDRRPDSGGCAATRAIVALVLLVVLAGAAPTEEALVRRMKSDVLDKNWAVVLEDCEQILDRFPDSPARELAAFNRARALSRLPGREQEGIDALRAFLASPRQNRTLVEEAWPALFGVACGQDRRPSDACRDALRRGLADPSPFVSTLSAIRVADVDDAGLRRDALPVLKKAYHTQTDSDIRNEILIAILKIAPDQVPAPEGREAPSGKKAKNEPTIIRLSVFDKEEGRFELKVQFPVAFARMLIDALDDKHRQELRREARRQGIDIDQIFDAIRRSGTGRLLQVDTEDSRIEIWVE